MLAAAGTFLAWAFLDGVGAELAVFTTLAFDVFGAAFPAGAAPTVFAATFGGTSLETRAAAFAGAAGFTVEAFGTFPVFPDGAVAAEDFAVVDFAMSLPPNRRAFLPHALLASAAGFPA